jgi:hypothetical protein
VAKKVNIPKDKKNNNNNKDNMREAIRESTTINTMIGLG